MNQILGVLGGQTNVPGVKGVILFAAVIVWTLVWKGLALWRAAREESKWWFVALMVVNTLGILEIVYLFFLSDRARETRAAGASSKTDGGSAA